jgi:hypothetical protein
VGIEVWLDSFFNLDARWDGGQHPTSAALPPEKRPVTHYIGGWVGPRAGLDGCGKSRLHQDSIPGPYCYSLYLLSYSGPHVTLDGIRICLLFTRYAKRNYMWPVIFRSSIVSCSSLVMAFFLVRTLQTTGHGHKSRLSSKLSFIVLILIEP